LASSQGDPRAKVEDVLVGRRVLIVEDDPFIATALEEMLAEQGLIIVGVARSLSAALTLAHSAQLDVALLDVNLRHESVDPVADALTARCCPFVFTTGCGRAGLPERFADRPVVEKPFYIEEILKTLREQFVSPQFPGKS
jgi:CheY-like chemotaxis protein